MKRSTAAIVAIATLLLGSSVSGLAFVKPALDQQGKLTQQKHQLTQAQLDLKTQVETLENKLKNMAMDSIAYFDLRASTDQPRAVEAKTVETLNSLTEIFNDDHLRIVHVTPTDAPTPAPSPVPSGAPSPSGSPNPGAAAGPGAISLTKRAFTVEVHGEYGDIVHALTAIQALPKAIAIGQYDVHLIHDPLKPAADSGKPSLDTSPTALALSFQVTITYLMAGGPPVTPSSPMPSPGPSPLHALAPGGWVEQLADWVAGEPAFAEASAPAVATGAHTHFLGVKWDHDRLLILTTPGAPRFTSSVARNGTISLVLEDTDTAKPGTRYGVSQGGITIVSSAVDPKDPRTLHLQIETKGVLPLVPSKIGDQLVLLRPGAAPPSDKPAIAVKKLPPDKRALPEIPRLAPSNPAPFSPIPEDLTLRRSLTSRYNFPIDRAHTTGRANPFKPLIVVRPLVKLNAVPPLPRPVPLPPLPGAGNAASLPASAGNPAADGGAYVLKAVLIGGGAPTAIIGVGGHSLEVSLNGTLPGNAKVKAIEPDRVVLSTAGGDLPLSLKK